MPFDSYFSKIGYPTLSIDRLGAGESDRPDPINIVQASLQTNINHVIVQMLRSGTVPNTGDIKFEKVIFVGGSYGSILGNVQALQYPDDVDSYILTAYTSNYTLLVGIFSFSYIITKLVLTELSIDSFLCFSERFQSSPYKASPPQPLLSTLRTLLI